MSLRTLPMKPLKRIVPPLSLRVSSPRQPGSSLVRMIWAQGPQQVLRPTAHTACSFFCKCLACIPRSSRTRLILPTGDSGPEGKARYIKSRIRIACSLLIMLVLSCLVLSYAAKLTSKSEHFMINSSRRASLAVSEYISNACHMATSSII